jgi:transposase
VAQGRQGQPSAVILDGRTLQSTCESGARAGYDGYKRKKGSKVHMAVDTLGLLLAVHVTPANDQERAQVQELARQVQHVSRQTVKLAFADQGYTGGEPAKAARDEGIELQVIKLPEAKKGFVLLPRRWVVERSFAGSIAFDGSRASTTASLKRWPVCISSSSPCSFVPSPCSKVHNTL